MTHIKILAKNWSFYMGGVTYGLEICLQSKVADRRTYGYNNIHLDMTIFLNTKMFKI